MPPAATASLAQRIRNIPPVTRFFTISTMIVCFANSLQLIDPGDLLCSSHILWEKFAFLRTSLSYGGVPQRAYAIAYSVFQCHRFFSAFLLPMGILVNQPFQAILDIYFFYTFANHLESRDGKFHGNFPDCLWFTLLTGTIIVLSALFYQTFIDESHFFVHHQMMLSCVTYLWSRSSKNSLINFLGLVPIKAYYLPVFNLLFKLIMIGYPSCVDTIVGIWGGYIYQCIQSDTLPIYNLLPGAYSKFVKAPHNQGGRRVGTIFPGGESHGPNSNAFGDGSNIHGLDNSALDHYVGDSIFDEGHLKAPLWLYRLLNYPINSSTRTTAFYPRRQAPFASNIAGGLSSSAKPSSADDNAGGGVSFTGSESRLDTGSGAAFRGKGRRLGD